MVACGVAIILPLSLAVNNLYISCPIRIMFFREVEEYLKRHQFTVGQWVERVSLGFYPLYYIKE